MELNVDQMKKTTIAQLENGIFSYTENKTEQLILVVHEKVVRVLIASDPSYRT